MNTINRRLVLGGIGALGATGVLAGCGAGSAGKPGGAASATGDGGAKGYEGPNVELDFWNGFTGGDGPFMRKLVDQFNSEHPNIKVKMTVMQWSDYYTKLPTAVSSGRGPAVAIMHVDSLATNAARNVIEPLDDVAKALELKQEDFAEVVWKAGEYNGKRYGIPLDVHPLGFFYNKTLMEKAGLDPAKPPATADEYAAALEALKGKGMQGHWASPFQFTGVLSVQALIWQFGGDLFSPDSAKTVWQEEPGVKALSWFVDLVKNGHSPKNVAQDADAIALQNGKTAFNWNGIWNINTLKEKTSLQWGVAPIPNIGGTNAAWAGSHQFCLPKLKTPDENKSTAARVFVNYVSQKSLEWAKGGQVPARKQVRESAEFKALPEQASLATQIDDLHFPPPVPGIGDALAELNKAVNEAVLLKAEPGKALADAAARADKILEANRKKYGA
ncbi:multiple sugar transport system substrate-binding protein [Kribbella amoyensis]|uniref:Multiple sugar transport system substrate-binding protein n=1 Tax=Kribbella amoyensis TaxID=996641 RepID=A0A561BP38_9ACTN|nr:ABC transporter substrate-binding protein [Kribbella amoyensis]TWD80638.1 multiple sugar transport system substrate-binding protein [Kribbella amoyensis]